MMIKAPNFATAMAIVGPLAIATMGESFAAPMNTVGVKAAVPAAVTDVRYRAHVDRPKWGYAYNLAYLNYSYCGYPTYLYRGYPTYSYLAYLGYGYTWDW